MWSAAIPIPYHGDDDSICITDNLRRWNSSQPLSPTLPHNHTHAITTKHRNYIQRRFRPSKCHKMQRVASVSSDTAPASRGNYFSFTCLIIINSPEFYKHKILRSKCFSKNMLIPLSFIWLNLKFPFHKQVV